jgi:hypothetical protein
MSIDMDKLNTLIKQQNEWRTAWNQSKVMTERLGAQILEVFKGSFPIGSTILKSGERYQVGAYDRDMLFCYKFQDPIDKDTMFGFKPEEVELVQ